MYGGGAVRTGCGKENEKKVSSVDLEMWHAVEKQSLNNLLRQLFKQGESFDLNNYRPISIISVVAKVSERIVYDLYNFLNSEEIISKQQSGFRSLHSTVTTLLEATDGWAFNIDSGYVNAVVFLDLKKRYATLLIMRYYELK